MANCPELAVLDVGHGNATLICDGGTTMAIDAPYRSSVLLETLEWREIKTLNAVVVSHSDADHAGGVMALLTAPNIAVEAIYLNPDALKRSGVWDSFQEAVRDGEQRGEVVVHTQLTTSTKDVLDTERLRVEVLAPAPHLAMRGVGGTTPNGRRLEANTMSAVIRVTGVDDTMSGSVLLMGDVDELGLDEACAGGTDFGADAVVFAHHGGGTGGDAERFAGKVAAAVAPKSVVFSIGRRPHELPKPGVVFGVRRALGGVDIACTQLSRNCSRQDPAETQEHLSEWPAGGRASRSCCAGTVVFHFESDGLVRRGAEEHRAYAEAFQDGLCHVQVPLEI
jgi:beta-lactamase superfamily II metal-dependent hydrolase